MANYLITGASSGIGAACAKRLSQDGHTVVLVARNIDALMNLVDELPNRAYFYSYDLNELNNIKSIFDFCKDNGIKLDGMIYSAGVNADVPIKVCKPDLFEKVMHVNCMAFAEMGKYFYSKKYSNDYSKIVAISSSASISCEKGMGLYSASKAALNSLVKTMSQEFVRRGILVNAVLPAGVLTPMAAVKIQTLMNVEAFDLDGAIKEIENNPINIMENEAQPFGIITPNCLAEFIGYLVSDKNRYITGALLPVSAGFKF